MANHWISVTFLKVIGESCRWTVARSPAGAERQAAPGRQRRLAAVFAGRHDARRHSLHTADGPRRPAGDVQSRGVRHGRPEVLARLGRGEEVDASEYTFRTSTRIETAAPDLDWLNKGVFISVAGRQPGGVIYETYLVE